MFTWFAERSDTNLTNCPVAEYILTSVIMPLSDWIVKFWFAGLGNRLIPDSVLIKSFKPAVMVVGSDYLGKRVIGSEWAGEVKYFDRFEDLSTSKILKTNG